MDKTAEHIVGWTFVLLGAIAAIGGVLVRFADMGSEHPGGGDLATWMGAVFAGLAFAGTITIATTEARERRRSELLRARLAASAMVLRLTYAEGRIDKVLSEMELSAAVDRGYIPFDQSVEYLEMIDIWTTEELFTLAAIPKIAVQLAEGSDQILASIKILENMSNNPDYADGPGRMQFASEFHHHLATTRYMMASSRDMCRAAADDLQKSAFG